MQLRLEPVTQENRLAVLSLRAGTGQEGFVETVSACLDEAAQRADWRPMAIYDGTAVVGFAMYGYFWEYPPAGRVWLDRLLIDAARQGAGRKGQAVKQNRAAPFRAAGTGRPLFRLGNGRGPAFQAASSSFVRAASSGTAVSSGAMVLMPKIKYRI